MYNADAMVDGRLGASKYRNAAATGNNWGPFDENKLFAATDFIEQRCCEMREIVGNFRHIRVELVGFRVV